MDKVISSKKQAGAIPGIPSLRIAVTSDCNMRCLYCPLDGDSYLLEETGRLDRSSLIHILDLAYETGFRYFSVTGGEPLLVPETTFEVAKNLRRHGTLGYLRLNTNGTLLTKYSEEVTESFDKVKVSVDTLIKNDLHDNRSLDGLLEMKTRKIDSRVNMVVGTSNLHEVSDMISFCERDGFELKLFDIARYRDVNSADTDYWDKEYVSLLNLIDRLSKEYGTPKIEYSIGGYGSPMLVFKSGFASPIYIRSGEIETRYHSRCARCPDFPCHDGFCNLTLTPDGHLKTCRPKGISFLPRLIGRKGILESDAFILHTLSSAINLFKDTKRKKRTCGLA